MLDALYFDLGAESKIYIRFHFIEIWRVVMEKPSKIRDFRGCTVKLTLEI